MSGVRYPVRKTELVLRKWTACREKNRQRTTYFILQVTLNKSNWKKTPTLTTHLSHKDVRAISNWRNFLPSSTSTCNSMHSLWRKWYKSAQRQNWEGKMLNKHYIDMHILYWYDMHWYTYIEWYGIHFFH